MAGRPTRRTNKQKSRGAAENSPPRKVRRRETKNPKSRDIRTHDVGQDKCYGRQYHPQPRLYAVWNAGNCGPQERIEQGARRQAVQNPKYDESVMVPDPGYKRHARGNGGQFQPPPQVRT